MNSSRQPPPVARYGLLGYLRPYWFRLALVLGVLVLTTIFGLLQPFLIQQLIDRVLTQGKEDLIWIFPVAIVGIATLRFGLGVAHATMYAAVTARVLLDMRVDFVEHLQKMSPRFFSGTRFGDVIIRLNRDLTQLHFQDRQVWDKSFGCLFDAIIEKRRSDRFSL